MHRARGIVVVFGTLLLAACGSRSDLTDLELPPLDSLIGTPERPDAGEPGASDAGGPGASDAGEARPRRCSSSGTVVLAELTFARYLALDDDYVYWADERTLARVPKCGGEVERLGQVGQGNALDLVVVGDFVYATVLGGTFGEGQIVRAPKSGGSVQVLTDPVTSAEPLVSDGSAIFWGDYSGIERIALDGGPVTRVATSSGSTYGSFPVDDRYVYWLDDAIHRASKLGGPAEKIGDTVADGYPSPWCAEADATHIYWTEYTGGAYRIPKTGGTPEQIAEAAAWRCLTLDGTHAYLARDAGELVAVAKATGQVTGQGFPGATDVKVDQHYIYSTAGIAPGRVHRRDKLR